MSNKFDVDMSADIVMTGRQPLPSNKRSVVKSRETSDEPASDPAMSDFDSPWKEALDCYFPAFLDFFFSDIHGDIDWSRGYEMLDTELQQVVRTAELGRRHVDKLVKVWRRDGQEAWVLI